MTILYLLLLAAPAAGDAAARAWDLLREGRVEAARAALSGAKPLDTRAALILARVEKASGRLDAADRLLAGIEAPPGSTAALLRDRECARVACRLGRAEDARAIAEEFARAHPGDPWVRAWAVEIAAAARLLGAAAPEPGGIFRVDIGRALAERVGWGPGAARDEDLRHRLRARPIRALLDRPPRGPLRGAAPGRRRAIVTIVRRRDLEPGGAVPAWIVPWARRFGPRGIETILVVELGEGEAPSDPSAEGIDPEGQCLVLWTRDRSVRERYGAARLPWAGFVDRRARLAGWKAAEEFPAEGEAELERSIGRDGPKSRGIPGEDR